MINYVNFTTPPAFRSKFNPVIGLHPDFLLRFNQEFLHPTFLKLTSSLGIPSDNFEYLNINDLITEKEFEDISSLELAKPYFYEHLFEKIMKSENGRIRNKIKFTFTYDVSLTPILKENSRYGVINLGNKPIFYYCYIELQEAINFIKQIE